LKIIDKYKQIGLHLLVILVLQRLREKFFQPLCYAERVLFARFMGLKCGSNARLLKHSLITGHQNIVIGNNFVLSNFAHLKSMSSIRGYGVCTIEIEDNVFVNEFTIVDSNLQVKIGRNTMIGPHCLIIDSNHVFEDNKMSISEQGCIYKPTIIGEDCWIGAHVVVLPGVAIGNHVIVAANSTVSKDIPDYAIVAGTPAQILRYRNQNENTNCM
jgi:acetyltransferase-like isoleucine patch superfamily enzyme